MSHKTTHPLLISVVVTIALVVSACAAEEPSSETVTTRRPTTEAPTTTTEPVPDPRALYVPDCDDASDCAAGFVLNEVFYSVGCIAIKEEFVTEETLGGGDFSGTAVSVNIVEGVDPSQFVALSLPGGQCQEGDEATSTWSMAFDGEPKPTDRAAICKVGLLTEPQLLANVCIDQLGSGGASSLPAEVAQEANELMAEFVNAMNDADGSARGLWSGYPAAASRKDPVFTAFANGFPWIETREAIIWKVVPSAGSTGSPVGVITDNFDQGASFVLSPSSDDGPAMIQRLAEPSANRFTPSDRSRISSGTTVVFRGAAPGGEVKAYLFGVELTEVSVSAAGTVSVLLPEQLPPLVIFTITFATADLPRAATAVYFFRE